MDSETILREILPAFGLHSAAGHVRDLGAAGGFSGARFWQLKTESGPLCLRRWPREHPCPARLELIHAVLDYAARQGIGFVPKPIKTRQGGSYARGKGYLWELTRWLPGKPCETRPPRPEHLCAAMKALATFHRATASFGDPVWPGPSPGIERRRQMLEGLLAGELTQLEHAITAQTSPELAPRARRLLENVSYAAPEVIDALKSAARLTVPQQPCIRDIWYKHVLFVNECVSGLIDFGALRYDNVAADIARLLGSYALDDPTAWQIGLDAYKSVRDLNLEEQRLITVFDRSTVLLGGINWIKWVFVEGRHFSDPQAVRTRLDEFLDRQRVLARRL